MQSSLKFCFQFGGFLDAIVKALNYYGTEEAKPTKTFTTSRFYRMGLCYSISVRRNKRRVYSSNGRKLTSQNTADLENNNVAEAFLAYCAGNLEIVSASEDQPFETTLSEVFQVAEEKSESFRYEHQEYEEMAQYNFSVYA